MSISMSENYSLRFSTSNLQQPAKFSEVTDFPKNVTAILGANFEESGKIQQQNGNNIYSMERTILNSVQLLKKFESLTSLDKFFGVLRAAVSIAVTVATVFMIVAGAAAGTAGGGTLLGGVFLLAFGQAFIGSYYFYRLRPDVDLRCGLHTGLLFGAISNPILALCEVFFDGPVLQKIISKNLEAMNKSFTEICEWVQKNQQEMRAHIRSQLQTKREELNTLCAKTVQEAEGELTRLPILRSEIEHRERVLEQLEWLLQFKMDG